MNTEEKDQRTSCTVPPEKLKKLSGTYSRTTAGKVAEQRDRVPQQVMDEANRVSCIDIAERNGCKLMQKGNNRKELSGPCPKCGGDDRFNVQEGWFLCRSCHPKKGDTIGLVKFLGLARNMPEAVRHLVPGYDPATRPGAFSGTQERTTRTTGPGAATSGPSAAPPAAPSQTPATVQRIAEKTGLPIDFLTAFFKLEDSGQGVIIPYLDQKGNPGRTRIRVFMDGERNRFTWRAGGQILPYGLFHLDRNTDRLFIVEGESDTWTLIHEGFPVLGLPGTEMSGKLQAGMIPPTVKDVFIVQEADEAGRKFPALVEAQLRKIGYTGSARTVAMPQEAKDPTDLRKADPATFKARFARMAEESAATVTGHPGENTLDRSADPASKEPRKLTLADLEINTAAGIMAMDIPPIRWTVKDLLPEGLTILAGPPKVRKSFLSMDLAASVASGDSFLGNEVVNGSVLVLALEDSLRRIKWRYGAISKTIGSPADNLHFATNWPQLEAGGLALLHDFLAEHPDTRLVVIDVLQRVRSAGKAGRNVYDQDYSDLTPLHTLAKEHRTAILMITHFNKSLGSESIYNRITGSSAMQGAVDTMWCMSWGQQKDQVKLDIAGRDVMPQEVLMEFSEKELVFRNLGDAKELNRNKNELSVLRAIDAGVRKPRDIVEETDLPKGTIRDILRRLVEDGIIRKEGNTPNTMYFRVG